jgi:hypothetical protein
MRHREGIEVLRVYTADARSAGDYAIGATAKVDYLRHHHDTSEPLSVCCSMLDEETFLKSATTEPISRTVVFSLNTQLLLRSG